MKANSYENKSSPCQKTCAGNLFHHVQSWSYYARIRVRGKLIWKRHKTDCVSVAKSSADFDKFLACAGFYKSEASQLTLADCDFAREKIIVKRSSVIGANYDVVIINAGGSVTSSVAPLTIRAPYPVAYWRMEAQISAPNSAGVPTFVGVADSATKNGQGIFTTGSLPAEIDDLITFNGLSGGPVILNTNVAPAAMFVNSHSGGNYSYNAEAITNVDGALLFPQDQYGDELDFTGPFSLELFFKTDGHRSGAGVMQLVAQGTDTGQTFRYGINVNEAALGGVRFKLANSSLLQTNVVDLNGTNYADGQWHYLLAIYDTLADTNGQLRLTIVNQDGSQVNATNNLSAAFVPLPAADNGNLFVGRNTYPVSANPQTFLGLIDEVQITTGVVPDTWRIGQVPAIDHHPQIKNVSGGPNGVSFQWTGAAPNNFLVQWVAHLGDAWQTIATFPSANSSAS